MIMRKAHRFRIPAAALVALSFFVLIFFGTALLCLPVATRDGSVNFLNSLFTATSASCVTGLAVRDTFDYWSGFGQAVILLLIQVGGLGFITIMSLFLLYVKKHTSLSQRKLVMQSAGSVDLVSVKSLVKIILIGTLIFEFGGAFLLSISFVQRFGWGNGIWQAVFTSVSAFCNAGFTLTSGGRSLTGFISDPLVIITVSLLIICGGIGFFVWGDVVHHGIRLKKYSFHSKVVLTATGVLIAIGWIFFGISEWNASLKDYDAGTKILASMFMSVTPRTAGFNSVDYSAMSGAGNMLTTVFMFIGGSPGSTAGGVKTTTIVVFFMSMMATAKRYEEIHLYKRRFEHDASAQASAVLCLYFLIIITSIFAICAIEGAAFTPTAEQLANGTITFGEVSFEVVSAVGTVGLSCGITSGLHVVSQIILVLLMFFGRVGGFTLVLVFSGDKKPVSISRVAEHIIIG